MRKFDSYYDYEFLLGRNILVLFLKELGISLNSKRVLDVGCGEGGILAGLASCFKFKGFGIDYDEDMIRKCKKLPDIRFETGDFINYEFKDNFDFIILRDVLEHCVYPEEMLARTATLLSAKGLAYVTYTPYLSPFGGHQHNGSTFFANIPYIHFLPESLFLRLIKPSITLYKQSRYLMEDLKGIRSTWITSSMVRKICKQHGLNILHKKMFLIRPDYRYKFGLPEISIPSALPIGVFIDPFITSVELLLSKK